MSAEIEDLPASLERWVGVEVDPFVVGPQSPEWRAYLHRRELARALYCAAADLRLVFPKTPRNSELLALAGPAFRGLERDGVLDNESAASWFAELDLSDVELTERTVIELYAEIAATHVNRSYWARQDWSRDGRHIAVPNEMRMSNFFETRLRDLKSHAPEDEYRALRQAGYESRFFDSRPWALRGGR